MQRAAIPFALLVAFTLAACGDDGSAGSTGESPSGDEIPEDVVVVDGTEAEVTAIDNTFDAAAIQVRPGTTVRWTNNGRQDHNILPAEDDGWGAEADEFQPDETYEHVFDRAGAYDYYCSLHGTPSRGMRGTIVVAD